VNSYQMGFMNVLSRRISHYIFVSKLTSIWSHLSASNRCK